jgi:hypothetical protein
MSTVRLNASPAAQILDPELGRVSAADTGTYSPGAYGQTTITASLGYQFEILGPGATENVSILGTTSVFGMEMRLNWRGIPAYEALSSARCAWRALSFCGEAHSASLVKG